MESFEEMFEQSLKSINAKSIIEGEIIALTDNEIFVNIGYKADGIISKNELSYDEDVDIKATYKIGDIIKVYVVRLNDGLGNVELSIKRIDEDKNKENLDNLVESKEIVKGKVSEILDKGIRVKYKSSVVFIPSSQLSIANLKDYQGKEISFRIIENKRNRVIGTEKAVMREINAQKAIETLNKIAVGDMVQGVVKRINDYGAFVDIGGIEGLLHVSQMTWKKNADPKQFVQEGQVLNVQIIELDKENKKISLKLKKDEDNPWNRIGAEIKLGDILNVKVLRIVPFGVFVEVLGGIDGFIHISQICEKRINSAEEVLKVGQVVEAKLIKIDLENKKIELTIRGINDVTEAEILNNSNEKAVKGENN